MDPDPGGPKTRGSGSAILVFTKSYAAGQLEEERQVTANLSKNLELERRKVESLEQKAKVMDIA